MEPVTALLSVPGIVALVNITKRAGLPARWAPLVAIVLGIAIAVLDELLTGNVYYAAATNGLLVALAASGVYDLLPGDSQPRRALQDDTL